MYGVPGTPGWGTSGTSHAFLYSGGTMTDLNSLIDPASGWELTYASDINDYGWIVGTGQNPSGQQHAFLLKPIVPEPSTIVLIGIGAVTFLAYAWRWRKAV
jgi:probable HAF family extracellular repeat protein